MKSKALTFIWQNMMDHTHNLLQWRTEARTLAEAWVEARSALMQKHGRTPEDEMLHGDYALMYAFWGLIAPISDDAIFRPPTRDEITALTQAATRLADVA